MRIEHTMPEGKAGEKEAIIAQLTKENRYMKIAIRIAYENLEQSANSPIPSLLAVRGALQALKPYLD